jgi:hypothetical protein
MGSPIQQQFGLIDVGQSQHKQGYTAGLAGRMGIEAAVERLSQLGCRTEQRGFDPWLGISWRSFR